MPEIEPKVIHLDTSLEEDIATIQAHMKAYNWLLSDHGAIRFALHRYANALREVNPELRDTAGASSLVH